MAKWLRGNVMRVQGESMTPTLNPGALVWVNPTAYAQRPPKRGEIVAVRPSALSGRACVKRLIGLPRERVELDGRSWRLSENQFFLVGDQRDHSVDSRMFGPVGRNELIGPVEVRLWPWRRFERTSSEEEQR